MKTIQVKLKTLLLLVLVNFIFVSCGNDKKEGQKGLKKQMDELEDGDSFAGSSKRDDICQLLTKDDVRSVFVLADEVKLKQEESHNAICSYDWNAPGGEAIFYSLSLNFAQGEKRTNNQIDAAWESQNNGIYKKWHPQKVPGVGDRASWSDLGGGQLRVAANGYIFYVSYSVRVIRGEDKHDTQGMIAKTKTLAKKVIERM